jgi:hypothetical protein
MSEGDTAGIPGVDELASDDLLVSEERSMVASPFMWRMAPRRDAADDEGGGGR